MLLSIYLTKRNSVFTLVANTKHCRFKLVTEHGTQTRDGTFKEREHGTPRSSFKVHERHVRSLHEDTSTRTIIIYAKSSLP